MNEVERAYPDRIKIVNGDEDFEVYRENAMSDRPSEIYVRASWFWLLGDARRMERTK